MTALFDFQEIKSAADREIDRFGDLETGWHYGQGGAISRTRIKDARNFLANLHLFGFKKINAFPGEDGSIMLVASAKDHLIELTLENNQSYTICHELDNDVQSYDENLDWTSARKLIAEIAKQVWPSFDWFTPSTTTKIVSASSRSRSKITMVGYPSSRATVLRKERA